MRRLSVVLIVLLLAVSALHAATMRVPADAELLGRADLVVVATVDHVATRELPDHMIVTDHRLHVVDVVKGAAPMTIVVTEEGGMANGHGVAIPGSASYAKGTRVLAFLRDRGDGTYYTANMALGVFRFAGDRLTRETEGIESADGTDVPQGALPAREFVDYVRALADGQPATRPNVIAEKAFTPETNAALSTYVLKASDNTPLRWNCTPPAQCNVCTEPVNPSHTPSMCGFRISGTQTPTSSLNQIEALNDAMSAWNNDANSYINLTPNGTESKTGRTNDDVNDIVFDWDGSNPHPSCDAAIGCGIVYFNGSSNEHTFRGTTFYNITSSDVLVKHSASLGQNLFEAILAHELGHSVGFTHAPTSGNLMSSSLPSSAMAKLGSWDKEAAAEIYGNGLPCTPVSVQSTSGGGTVTNGTPAHLSVTVNSDSSAPITYQWYEGTSGNTSTPVGTNSASYTTSPITTTRNFWVRVTNSCGTADSATITVNPSVCTGPVINGTTGGGSVTFNTSAHLAVQVDASSTSPLSYQWYEGPTGNTSNPVGTNSSYTTPPITSSHTYWVKVSNACGSANSASIEVHPGACDAPSITTQPASQHVAAGGTATLHVAATGTGTLTFTWYTGPVGNTSTPVGNGPDFTTPALNSTATYWARVSSNCGSADSALATITVGTQCVPVTITSQPGSVQTTVGETVQLHVVASGDPTITYQWYAGDTGDTSHPVQSATPPGPPVPAGTLIIGPIPTAGTTKYWVRVSNGCATVDSVTVAVTALCPELTKPKIHTAPTVPYNVSYFVGWTGDLVKSPTFELQESRTEDFSGPVTTMVVNALQKQLSHGEVTTDTRFYYRVRAINGCTQQPSDYSNTTSTAVTQPQSPNSTEFHISVPATTSQSLTQNYIVPGFGTHATAGDTFSITTDVPWLSFSPAAGPLPSTGANVVISADTSALAIGTTTGTVHVTRTQPSGATAHGAVTNATSVSSTVPFSMSLVTPITPQPRDTNPPAGTMVIPATAHADGIGTRFQSDLRIVNAHDETVTYELNFTPSGNDGTQTGKSTTLDIGPNDSISLDDAVRAWYGAGVAGEPGLGTIEIRPIATISGGAPNPLLTYASSRTYSVTPQGTLGQYIPAIPLTAFIPNFSNGIVPQLSLQQVAQSATYRTNLGFVEGAGAPAELVARALDANNHVLAETPLHLDPYQHMPTSFSNVFPGLSLDDGRVEVEVTSSTGKVTAYASVLDNQTNDPLLVFPVQTGAVSQSRYVVPGVAELNAGSNFHTDMRIYNSASTPVSITLNYHPQAGDSTPPPAPVQLDLNPHEIRAIDSVLPTLWQLNATGGSVTLDAPNDTPLVVTARTFSRDAQGGTYGQFIPGVTALDAVGNGERSLEILQLEESPSYRANLGLVEVTGAPVDIEILGYTGTKLTSATQAHLDGNEFIQFGHIMSQLGFDNVYGGRVTVRVLGGSGRIAAYGSVVDNRTLDPTYVPAQ
ncbi:MAG: hypothetical protein JO197_14230 [Acidobacteria bacterium]|nr:hypothetical protein [Acidobacteriota bacterium]MBV9478703.1 hypothetical protein [Acidobacteriota bacterium]